MRALLRAALNCLVRNKPSIPATTQIASAGVRPTRDIALVLIRNTEGQPVDFDVTSLREMKNVFMAIVQKALGTNGFEMSVRSPFTKQSLRLRNRDRFNPVNSVLQNEQIAQSDNDFVRQHGI